MDLNALKDFTFFSTWQGVDRTRDNQKQVFQKYFPAILSHSGQSCFELSFHTSSQCGIALPFNTPENLMLASRQISQSADPSTIFIWR